MKLDVLGSSGTYPAPDRPASGYLVSDGPTVVMCDAGFGTFTELTRRIPPDRLDAVVLSHRHPDHCVDLLAIFHALAYGPYERDPLPVFCAPGVHERFVDFLGAGQGHSFNRVFDFHDVGETNHVAVGAIDLRFAVASHSVPTVCTRFEADGRSVAYSADTGPGGGYPELAQGSSVMLAEASIVGERADHHFIHHLTATETGRLARDAGVETLIVTHLPPSLDREQVVAEARAVFSGRIELAVPGAVYEI